nr:MAG TPA: hypothetical protein [Caudoviricetes sp.]
MFNRKKTKHEISTILSNFMQSCETDKKPTYYLRCAPIVRRKG